jgi:hypothetical protein
MYSNQSKPAATHNDEVPCEQVLDPHLEYKQIVMEGTMFDQYIPALSATLEYLKYEGGLGLPI